MTQRKPPFHIRDGRPQKRAAVPPASRPGAGGSARASGGGLWLYGTHPVLAALDNPHRLIRRLVATREVARDLAERLPATVEIMERPDLDRLLPAGAVHQGLVLQTEPLEPMSLDELMDGLEGRDSAVVLVLDQVTDPHNVGAVLRSAAAFGAVAVVVQDRHAPDESGVLAKSASGALERMPLLREVNLARALDRLKEGGFWCAGLAADGPVTLAQAKLSGRVALVLGSEGEGMRRLVRERCDAIVRLPITEAVESLNVSNAAAVALYELARDGALPGRD
jgi:23S rRNA (guanosine2251-2'-O)-methyltransferase